MFLSPSNATVKQLLKNKLRDYFKDINSQKQKDEGSDISNKTLRAGKSWCMCCNCHNFGPPPLFCFIFSLAGSWSGAWGWEEVLQIHREPTWMSWPEGIRGRGRDIQDKPYSVLVFMCIWSIPWDKRWGKFSRILGLFHQERKAFGSLRYEVLPTLYPVAWGRATYWSIFIESCLRTEERLRSWNQKLILMWKLSTFEVLSSSRAGTRSDSQLCPKPGTDAW